jgi:hypothetical protein
MVSATMRAVQATPALDSSPRRCRRLDRLSKQDLITCRALSCNQRRVRPGASHCTEHSVEWYAIEADQRALLSRSSPITAAELADLKARRFAMGMVWPPRNLK